VQISATQLPGQIELTYSFDLDRQLTNLRLSLPGAEPHLPSISSIYLCSILYENEIHDLFGVQVPAWRWISRANLQDGNQVPFATAKLPVPAARRPRRRRGTLRDASTGCHGSNQIDFYGSTVIPFGRSIRFAGAGSSRPCRRRRKSHRGAAVHRFVHRGLESWRKRRTTSNRLCRERICGICSFIHGRPMPAIETIMNIQCRRARCICGRSGANSRASIATCSGWG